jgi:integrase
MRFLSPDELARLVGATRPPYDVLVEVLAYGGLRWGEVAALTRSRCELLRSRLVVDRSVAEVGGTLHVGPTKNYQRREVPLPPVVKDRLAAHLSSPPVHHHESEDLGAADPLVFTAPDGGPLRHSNFRRRVWLPAARAAGLEPLRVHDLRHTCASLLISTGAHPKAISVMLGHSSIQITMDRYGHLFPDDMDRVAEGLQAIYVSPRDGLHTASGGPTVLEMRL